MKKRFSISKRLNLAFFILVALLIVALGISELSASSTINSTRGVQQDVLLLEEIHQLQFVWFNTMSSIDNLLQTQSMTHLYTVNDHFELFSQQLAALSIQSKSMAQRNTQPELLSLDNIQQTGQEVATAMEEFNQLVAQNQWDSAAGLRQSKLARLQSELDKELSQLNDIIQNNVADGLNSTVSTQKLIGNYWIVLSLVGIIFSFILSWLSQRSISRPIKQLTTEVKRISEGDFSPVQTPDRQDEIGDLYTAFSLMNDQLSASYENLEHEVAGRTHDLERRTVQIQVAAEVARDISTNRDIVSLLNHTVAIIPKRFDFYHAGVFLIDAGNEYAVLRAATQETGSEMLRLGHKLRVGETGLVGHVCADGEPRIALDVGEDAIHFKNPHLPLTRSEIALPLRYSDRIIGALDVQSTEASAFDQESILVLQVLADQLAIAIENTFLLQELRENISELELLSGTTVRNVWRKQNQSTKVAGYQYDGLKVEPIYVQDKSYREDLSNDHTPVSLPITIRDQAIGKIKIWPSQGDLSFDEFNLVKDISNRIGQVLENARLFEESRNRAEREKLTGEINAKLRASNDPQTILETAVTELRKALKVKHAQVTIEPIPTDTPGSTTSQSGFFEGLPSKEAYHG